MVIPSLTKSITFQVTNPEIFMFGPQVLFAPLSRLEKAALFALIPISSFFSIILKKMSERNSRSKPRLVSKARESLDIDMASNSQLVSVPKVKAALKWTNR